MPRLPAVTCLQGGLLTCRLKDSLAVWLGQRQADDKVSGGSSNEPKAREGRVPPEAGSRAQTCLASPGSPAPAPPAGTRNQERGLSRALPRPQPCAASEGPSLHTSQLIPRSGVARRPSGVRPPLALCKILSWKRLLVFEVVEVKPNALFRSGKMACYLVDLPLSFCR